MVCYKKETTNNFKDLLSTQWRSQDLPLGAQLPNRAPSWMKTEIKMKELARVVGCPLDPPMVADSGRGQWNKPSDPYPVPPPPQT